MKTKQQKNRCVICNLDLADRAKDKRWLLGNNAQPVKDGRCCDQCNTEIVLPARIALLVNWKKRNGQS
jgi:hypothetical protein